MQLTEIQYDSQEEVYFAAWLDALKGAGLVDDWWRNIPPIKITDGLSYYWVKETKLKTFTRREIKEHALLKPSEYTPDFKIYWNASAEGFLFDTLSTAERVKLNTPFIAQYENGRPFSIVEVKPVFDRNNMTRLFKNNQKFIWDKHQIFVNLIHIEKLFNDTFTPLSRLFGKKGQPLKVKWKVQTIENYLNNNNYHDRKQS